MQRFAALVGLIGLISADFAYCGEKKVIYSGWDNQDTQFIRDHWQEMDRTPLDGTGILVAIDREGWASGKKKNTGNDLGWRIVSPQRFTVEQFAPAVADMKDVRFARLKDNFLTVQLSSAHGSGLHWFADDRWALFLDNLVVITEVARQIGAKGLILDVEHYGYQLFNHKWVCETYHPAGWDTYQKKVFERGVQVMQAINKAHPDITLLFYYAWDIALSEAKRTQDPSQRGYGLVLPFLEGMLSTATPTTVFVNGHEPSYPFKDERQFVKARRLVLDDGLKLTQYPERFRSQVQMGFGLWIDYGGKLWDQQDHSKNFFSPDQWGKSLRYGLTHSDQYVWVYSHHARFFNNPNIPETYLKAFQAARR